MRTTNGHVVKTVGGVSLAVVAVSCALASVVGSIGPWPPAVVFRRSASLVGLIAVLVTRRAIQGRSIRAWGVIWSASAGRDIALGFGLAAGWFLAVVSSLVGTGVLRWHVDGSAESLALSLSEKLVAMALVAVIEEVIFRGWLLQELLGALSKSWAVALSALVYAGVHFAKPWSPEVPPQWVGLWLFGIVLAGAYLKTGRLWCSIGLHWGAAYLTLVDKYFLEFVGSPMWWSVGGGKLYDGLWGWMMMAALLPILGRLIAPRAPKVAG